MEFDRDALLQTFLAEAEEQLDAFEQTLLELDRGAGGDTAGPVAELFRIAHTLKGNAETLGFAAVGQCAHNLESVLDGVRTGVVSVRPGLVDALLAAHDALASMVSLVARGESPRIEAYDDAMQALAEAQQQGSSPSGNAYGAGRHVAQGETARGRKSLRVDLGALDRVVTTTGQLSIAFARLQTLLRPLEGVEDALSEVERLFGDLREQAMGLRLVRIGPLLRQQLRSVRDLAVLHAKLVRLVVEGEDVEVDASVLEGLRDPITHMVRNAVDHAIEAPEARTAAGKDPMGTITLRASYDAGWVTVEVTDDGGGFRRQRILDRAHETGLLPAGTSIRDEDLLRLVLLPGFSTAPSVTRTSGRGVGMDVVAKNVADLKGFLSIRSEEGLGTTLTIRVPLTLAILNGFAVDAGAERFVIPMDAVRECVAFPPRDDTRDMLLELRGEPLPCLRLNKLFGLPGPAAHGAESVVVLEHQGMRAGLVVDGLVGGTDAVVKPLSGSLEGIDGISGSTILGDGRVALILDIPAIVRGAAAKAAA